MSGRAPRLRLPGRLCYSRFLLLAVVILAGRAVFGPYIMGGRPQRSGLTSESCDLSQCIAPPASVHLMFHDRFRTWLNDQLSPACQEKCWIGYSRELCQDCSDLDAPGNEEKKRQCQLFCDAHGSCPMTGPIEKPHYICPPYDPSLRESRVALLRSLGASVQLVGKHGIEVRCISIRETRVLANTDLQCTIQHLTHDYGVVNFKGQEGTNCELDMAMCYTLGRTLEGRGALPQGPRINAISNHPLLGLNTAASGSWHVDGLSEACTHGVIDVVEAHPPHGSTGLSAASEAIKSLPKETLEYWKRIWWESMNGIKAGPTKYPLLVEHPITNELVIYIQNFAKFGVDMDKPFGRMFEPEESQQFHDQLNAVLDVHHFNMTLETGDFTYTDNLLLLHKAWPESWERPDLSLRLLRKAACNCHPLPSVP